MISFVPEIFKFSYYANLSADDATGCASTVVRHKIKNISTNNEAILLKLGRDVEPYEIYLGPVVQRLDNANHWINHYPADSVVCFDNTYPLDSDLSGG